MDPVFFDPIPACSMVFQLFLVEDSAWIILKISSIGGMWKLEVYPDPDWIRIQ